MANANGNKWIMNNLWKIVVAVVVTVGGYAALTRDVKEMKPDVKKNNEHRMVFEEKVKTIDKNVTTMQLQQEKYHKAQTDKLDEIILRLPN